MASSSGSVTVTLQGRGEGHRFGVNALTSIDRTLYSAGRDGTVRCWSLEDSAECRPPTCARLEATMDEHTDWVNGIVAVQPGVVASCSSDRTVKVWSARRGGGAMRCETLGEHTDYAKALAFAPRRGLLASAGLDRRLLLWDPQRTSPIAASVAPGAAEPRAIHSDSIYALACNVEGTVLATGSVDTEVRLWDPRDLRSSLRLAGHVDLVRAVCLLSDGVRLASAGSDGTVRLWHLGQRQCEMVLPTHGAAVFALAELSSHAALLSAHADGRVRLTHLPSATSAPLARADAPALGMHVADDDTLWIASTDS